MPFVPFKKGGGKAAPAKGKSSKPNPFGAKKAPPFQAGQPKKTRRSPF
jgi:hypothetical protein